MGIPYPLYVKELPTYPGRDVHTFCKLAINDTLGRYILRIKDISKIDSYNTTDIHNVMYKQIDKVLSEIQTITK